VDPIGEPLSFFGAPAEQPSLEWTWVDAQLQTAPTYWVVGRSSGAPHPRPVWGAWHQQRLLLSIGSPSLRAQLDRDPTGTVHLDSGVDVVVVEARVEGKTSDPNAIAVYDVKYDWHYDAERYGPLFDLRPRRVLAWRAAGPAGRDGFVRAGRWRFE
jgi:hypothetical protein